MPAKTKRQKLLAEKHRQFTASVPSFSISAVSLARPAASSVQNSRVGEESYPQTMQFALHRKDMVRTIVLGLATVAVEFGIYWYSLIKR